MTQSLTLVQKKETNKAMKVMSFDEGVTIQCGASSMTLTPEGDIILSGKRLVQVMGEDVTIKAPVVQLNPK